MGIVISNILSLNPGLKTVSWHCEHRTCTHVVLHITLPVCCRLYSCLANGSADEFQKGENLYKAKAVKDPVQIGTFNCCK